MRMDMDQIITLINTVSNSSLSSFTLEDGDVKLSLEANRGVSYMEAPEKTPFFNTVTIPSELDNTIEEGNIVNSPLVGTFYSAQSEEAQPFVQVGDTVKQGQIIGIIEAMKLMNQVENEYDGVVAEIYVSNEQMVEYGQPLIRVVDK